MRFKEEFGTWQLDDLPGCSQVCVSHSAFVLPHQRGNGWGTIYHEARLNQMHDLHYDYAVATTSAGNEMQNSILRKAGWTILDRFHSRKTQHEVLLWGRKIG